MPASSYKDAKATAKATLRQHVVDGAIRVLETEGPASLSVRRVATEIGASTKVLYTSFGGKAGLIEALAAEGFARLTTRMVGAPRRRDPLARCQALGDAYLTFARDEPTFFAVMYGQVLAEAFPTKESREMARESLDPLRAGVAYAKDHGWFTETDELTAARTLWAAMHGPATLEANSWLTASQATDHASRLIAGLAYAEERRIAT